MSLLGVCIVLIVVGLLLWLAVKYIPMEPSIKNILIAVVVISLVLWLLNVFGLLHAVDAVKVPRLSR